MAMTFRDTKGSALTSDEVDENFRTLQALIEAVTGTPGVGIASIVQTGSTISIHMTDASVLGPFVLPKAAFTWRGDWEGGATYDPFDVFKVDDVGVFLVLRAYEAPTEFDPDASDTDGALLSQMFGQAQLRRIPVTSVTGDVFPTPADAGTYYRVTGGNVFLTHDSWEVGDIITVRRETTDVEFMADDSDITLIYPDDCIPQLRTTGSVATAICVATDVWAISGDLALAPLGTTTGP